MDSDSVRGVERRRLLGWGGLAAGVMAVGTPLVGAGDLADDIVTLAGKQESDDPAAQVAARRAALTLLHQAQANCDDSYGRVGMTVEGALDVYARTPWRQAGLDAGVFWRDFIEITCLMSNYGTPDAELMVELFRGAQVARDIDLVERVLREVKSEYHAARMSWHADTAGTWHACVAMAVGLVPGGHGR